MSTLARFHSPAAISLSDSASDKRDSLTFPGKIQREFTATCVSSKTYLEIEENAHKQAPVEAFGSLWVLFDPF